MEGSKLLTYDEPNSIFDKQHEQDVNKKIKDKNEKIKSMTIDLRSLQGESYLILPSKEVGCSRAFRNEASLLSFRSKCSMYIKWNYEFLDTCFRIFLVKKEYVL